MVTPGGEVPPRPVQRAPSTSSAPGVPPFAAFASPRTTAIVEAIAPGAGVTAVIATEPATVAVDRPFVADMAAREAVTGRAVDETQGPATASGPLASTVLRPPFRATGWPPSFGRRATVMERAAPVAADGPGKATPSVAAP